ncbi:MAG: iron-containing alcohol dehydrogenase [Candidatus Aminicenantes bacterium]|nr:iron-containing alcohol dehydrogenase [Candidatus Aminicenantes bacterium]
MQYQNPTRIVFSSGSIQSLNEIIEELRLSRPFLITDEGIEKAGILDRVLSQLDQPQVFREIEQNPKHLTVNRAGKLAREQDADLIIGVGGGSVLDAAKAVALLAANPGSIEDYEGKEKYRNHPLPVLAIPTTCGTGSEVTWVAVITHTERKFKMSIKGRLMFPLVALVDPDLLKTLPQPLIASTGLDALTHAVEAYTVKEATFLTDIFSREALKHIFRSLEAAYKDIRENEEAREGLMKGSLIAGLAFGNSDVGAVHCLAEAVGSLYDTPHGVANSIFLPYVMEFNLSSSVERYAHIARISGLQEESDATASRKLIQKIKDLSRALGIPSFKEIGIEEEAFPEIAQKSFANNSNPSNPREASAQDYLDILSRAYLES